MRRQYRQHYLKLREKIENENSCMLYAYHRYKLLIYVSHGITCVYVLDL